MTEIRAFEGDHSIHVLENKYWKDNLFGKIDRQPFERLFPPRAA